jgi:hypothetical protein
MHLGGAWDRCLTAASTGCLTTHYPLVAVEAAAAAAAAACRRTGASSAPWKYMYPPDARDSPVCDVLGLLYADVR